jgi:hypothetical protein
MHLELRLDLFGGRLVSFLSFRKDGVREGEVQKVILRHLVDGRLLNGGFGGFLVLWDGGKLNIGGLHLFIKGVGCRTRGGIITLQLVRLKGGGGRGRRGVRGTGRCLLE